MDLWIVQCPVRNDENGLVHTKTLAFKNLEKAQKYVSGWLANGWTGISIHKAEIMWREE